MTPEQLRAQLARPTEQLVVGYVTGGDPRSKFVDSLDRYRTFDTYIGAQRLHDPWRLQVRSGANISRARNEVVANFLDLPGKPPWLWLVDDDMVFPPDAIERLFHYAEPMRVVGGLCFSFGQDGIAPVLFDRDTVGRFVRWHADESLPENTVQAVAGTGAAFLLVHRDLLMKIGEKSRSPHAWFREVEIDLEDGSIQWISEDLFFCARAWEVGGEVRVHTGVEIGHSKSVVVGRALWELQRSGTKFVMG